MVAADSLILWFYQSSGNQWRLVAPPSVVAINCGLSQTHSARRVSILHNAGLLDLVDDRGYYHISDIGQRYITGAATKDEIDELDPETD
jgi:hypothetical protein